MLNLIFLFSVASAHDALAVNGRVESALTAADLRLNAAGLTRLQLDPDDQRALTAYVRQIYAELRVGRSMSHHAPVAILFRDNQSDRRSFTDPAHPGLLFLNGKFFLQELRRAREMHVNLITEALHLGPRAEGINVTWDTRPLRLKDKVKGIKLAYETAAAPLCSARLGEPASAETAIAPIRTEATDSI